MLTLSLGLSVNGPFNSPKHQTRYEPIKNSFCTKRKRTQKWISLPLLNMNINLSSLWTHLETMSFSLQYKRTSGMWRFNSFFELYGELSIKPIVTLSVLDSVTWHWYLHSTVWMRGALCKGANCRLDRAPIDRQSSIITCLFDAFRV